MASARTAVERWSLYGRNAGRIGARIERRGLPVADGRIAKSTARGRSVGIGPGPIASALSPAERGLCAEVVQRAGIFRVAQPLCCDSVQAEMRRSPPGLREIAEFQVARAYRAYSWA